VCLSLPGLSEVVGGLGTSKLHSLMPDIIQTAGRADITPNVRDGYIMMYIYLPGVFGDDFIPYVGQIIPSILKVCESSALFVKCCFCSSVYASLSVTGRIFLMISFNVSTNCLKQVLDLALFYLYLCSVCFLYVFS